MILRGSASLTYLSLKHSTYEIQSFTVRSGTSGVRLTNGTQSASGYRLNFDRERTFVTTVGGEAGCLLWDGPAAAVEAELEMLPNIDDVTVSRVRVIDDGTSGTGWKYLVTFVGDMVRGDMPQITVTDVGEDGCFNAEENDNTYPTSSWSTNYVFKDEAAYTSTVEQYSMVPIYKVQTTTDLAYDATAYDVKTALEALTHTCKVDVQRSAYGYGFAWTVTFTESRDGSDPYYTPLLPMLPNGRDLSAAVTPAVAVTPMQEVPVETDMIGVPTYVRVAAVNAHGEGAVKKVLPDLSVAAAAEAGAPKTAWVDVVSNTELLVQWEPPNHDGGDEITKYKVEWDTSVHFNSGDRHTVGYRNSAIERTFVHRRHAGVFRICHRRHVSRWDFCFNVRRPDHRAAAVRRLGGSSRGSAGVAVHNQRRKRIAIIELQSGAWLRPVH